MKAGYKTAPQKKSKSTSVKGYALSMPVEKSTLNLTEKDLPAIADWEVGKTYQVVLTVKEVSLSQDTRYGDGNKHATFEIQKAEVEEKDS